MKLLTPDDVIRTGACAGGVIEWMREHAPLATAVTVEQALALATSEEQVGFIERGAGLAGYGYGDGDGYGNGYGNGNGNGNGYGNGYGYGYGYGYGDGNGSAYR